MLHVYVGIIINDVLEWMGIQFSQHDEFALTAINQPMCVCLSKSASTCRDVINQST